MTLPPDNTTPDSTTGNTTAEQTPAPRAAAPRRLAVVAAAVGIGAVIGFVGVYGIGGLLRKSGDPVCRPAVDLAKRIAPLATGEVAALTPASTALRLPDLAFLDADGHDKKLSDWRGRTVLVNLWATWCVPCRKEMPALDALQAKLGKPGGFEVVAVNIDTRDPQKPRDFLTTAKISALSYFTDKNAKVFQDLKMAGRAIGMPTSILVDGNGCEIGTMSGPAEWASDDAVKLIEAALQPAS